VNSIWEGSGNVMCLDVLRAAGRSPDGLVAAMAELKAVQGADRRFDAFCRKLEQDFAGLAPQEGQARRLVERLVLALQGALLLKDGTAEIADAFCASRLAGDGGGAFGTLPPSIDAGVIARQIPPMGPA
jgi:putative acyl-CoA dehydrogenase